jgi:hypothetical protein
LVERTLEERNLLEFISEKPDFGRTSVERTLEEFNFGTNRTLLQPDFGKTDFGRKEFGRKDFF